MKLRLAILGIALMIACGCGDDRAVAGTDEHGNAMTARVLVRDSLGAPAAGVEVSLRPVDWLDGEPLDTSSHSSIETTRCVTDARGLCVVTPGAGGIALRAGDGELAAFAVLPRGTDSVTMLDLRPTGSVQGRLVGAGAGLVVRVPGIPGKAWTDDSGRFSLGSLPEGLRRVSFGRTSRLVLDSVVVRSRRALDFQVVLPDTSIVRRFVLDTFGVHAKPRTPVFSPAGGTYDTILEVTFPSLETGDAIETSEDGIRWNVLNGSIRLMATACIQARVIRDGRILSNVSKACYVIAP